MRIIVVINVICLYLALAIRVYDDNTYGKRELVEHSSNQHGERIIHRDYPEKVKTQLVHRPDRNIQATYMVEKKVPYNLEKNTQYDVREFQQPYKAEKRFAYPVKHFIKVPHYVRQHESAKIPRNTNIPYEGQVSIPKIITHKLDVPRSYTNEKHEPMVLKVPVQQLYGADDKVPYLVKLHIPVPQAQSYTQKKIHQEAKVPIYKPYTISAPRLQPVEKEVDYAIEKGIVYEGKPPTKSPQPVEANNAVPYIVTIPIHQNYIAATKVPVVAETPMSYEVKTPINRPVTYEIKTPINKPVTYEVKRPTNRPVTYEIKTPTNKPYPAYHKQISTVNKESEHYPINSIKTKHNEDATKKPIQVTSYSTSTNHGNWEHLHTQSQSDKPSWDRSLNEEFSAGDAKQLVIQKPNKHQEFQELGKTENKNEQQHDSGKWHQEQTNDNNAWKWIQTTKSPDIEESKAKHYWDDSTIKGLKEQTQKAWAQLKAWDEQNSKTTEKTVHKEVQHTTKGFELNTEFGRAQDRKWDEWKKAPTISHEDSKPNTKTNQISNSRELRQPKAYTWNQPAINDKNAWSAITTEASNSDDSEHGHSSWSRKSIEKTKWNEQPINSFEHQTTKGFELKQPHSYVEIHNDWQSRLNEEQNKANIQNIKEHKVNEQSSDEHKLTTPKQAQSYVEINNDWHGDIIITQEGEDSSLEHQKEPSTKWKQIQEYEPIKIKQKWEAPRVSKKHDEIKYTFKEPEISHAHEDQKPTYSWKQDINHQPWKEPEVIQSTNEPKAYKYTAEIPEKKKEEEKKPEEQHIYHQIKIHHPLHIEYIQEHHDDTHEKKWKTDDHNIQTTKPHYEVYKHDEQHHEQTHHDQHDEQHHESQGNENHASKYDTHINHQEHVEDKQEAENQHYNHREKHVHEEPKPHYEYIQSQNHKTDVEDHHASDNEHAAHGYEIVQHHNQPVQHVDKHWDAASLKSLEEILKGIQVQAAEMKLHTTPHSHESNNKDANVEEKEEHTKPIENSYHTEIQHKYHHHHHPIEKSYHEVEADHSYNHSPKHVTYHEKPVESIEHHEEHDSKYNQYKDWEQSTHKETEHHETKPISSSYEIIQKHEPLKSKPTEATVYHSAVQPSKKTHHKSWEQPTTTSWKKKVSTSSSPSPKSSNAWNHHNSKHFQDDSVKHEQWNQPSHELKHNTHIFQQPASEAWDKPASRHWYQSDAKDRQSNEQLDSKTDKSESEQKAWVHISHGTWESKYPLH